MGGVCISAMIDVKRPFVTATLAWEAMAIWPLGCYELTFHTSHRGNALHRMFKSSNHSRLVCQPLCLGQGGGKGLRGAGPGLGMVYPLSSLRGVHRA